MDKETAERTVFEHDFQKNELEDALQMVEAYIIKQNLILVGGMAIDFALRAKGDKLYGPDKLPDYDFITPTFHIDAYNIANELSKKYDGVDVINATHINTMRVRVNFVPVADVTYVPPQIYEILPTITYAKLRIIHPYCQMIDQHIALSLPYENAPRETIAGKRWTNDIERYDVLNKHYSMETKRLPQKQKFEMTIKYDLVDGECMGGYLALAYWLSRAKELGYLGGDEVLKLGEIQLNRNDMQVKLPNDAHVVFLSDNFVELLKKLRKYKYLPADKKKSKEQYFNSLYGKIPRRVQIDKFEILDNKGRMVGCYQPYVTKRFYVSNLQEVMVYLLTKHMYYGDEYAGICYTIARDLLFWACDKYTGLYLTTTEEANNNVKDKYFMFLPTPHTYGNFNWSESYIIAREKTINDIEGKNRYDIASQRPRKAYLTKGKLVPVKYRNFVPSKSKFYQIDGAACEPFAPLEFPELTYADH